MKRALLAGINRYEDPGIGRLLCAEKDALALELFLSERCGFAAQSLINEQATKRRITARLREICSELKDGDLFFFYFGGHGHEDPHTGQAVLLPWDVRLSDIEDQLNPELVPVRGIESASARCGASRFLVLDACRTPLRSGTKDSQARLEETAVRDIQAMVLEEARESAPLVTIFSCSAGQRAHELEATGRGVFSKALEEALAEYVAAGLELSLPGEAQARVARFMEADLKRYRPGARQNPHFSHNRPKVVLLEGRATRADAGGSDPPMGAGAGVHHEKCPICRKWNLITETFECPRCHRDFVCLKHRSEADRSCEECAKKLASERADAEGKAKRDAERQAELRRQETEKERLEKQRKRAEAEERPRPLSPAPMPSPKSRRWMWVSVALALVVLVFGWWKPWTSAPKPVPVRQTVTVPAPPAKAPEPAKPTTVPLPQTVTVPRPGLEMAESTWTNGLGMRFASVPGTKVLFSIWDTRVKDYAAYAEANSGVDGSWRKVEFNGEPVSGGPEHPVTMVNWTEAKAFCRWLTEKEQRAGLISGDQSYRLPADAEWSLAVGLQEASEDTPNMKDGKVRGVYPWGTWPPRAGRATTRTARPRGGSAISA